MVEFQRATSPADYGVTNAVDIGHGVQLSYVVDNDGTVMGVNTWHDCTHDYTAGMVYFDTSEVRERWPKGPHWKVEQREPLTLSPSIQCGTCGLHGFVRNGEWVPA